MLRGISPFKVTIVDANTIRKSADTAHDWIELRRRCVKQQEFNESNDPSASGIRSPRVLEINDEERWFTMVFERDCNHLIGYLSNDFVNHDLFFVDILCEYIAKTIENSTYRDITAAFHDNVWSLVEKCPESTLFDMVKFNYFRHLDRIGRIVVPVADRGSCHGNLSLSNMLADRRQLVFIGFGESIGNTIMHDIACLRQDTSEEIILHVNEFTNETLREHLAGIDLTLQEFFEQYEFYEKYYVAFQVMNLIAMIPHLTDKNFIDMLLLTCNAIMLTDT